MTQPQSDRYGSPGRLASLLPRRVVALLLGVLVVAAGLVVAYVGYVKFGPQNIEAEVVNSRIMTGTDGQGNAMAVTFTVTRKHPSEQVMCLLRVRDKDGNETGSQQVTIPSSASGSVTVDTVIHSSAPPTVDELVGCGTHVPSDI